MAVNKDRNPLPSPPRAPREFNVEWANQLSRWLMLLAQSEDGLKYLRGSGLYLPDLPSTGYGIKAGGVFSNDGALTIVRKGDVWVSSNSITPTAGNVTVTIV